MTSIAERLRDLVLSSPRDPAVRSVYADALIQEGDPRGTFIMLQSHLDMPIPPDKREEAKRQADELLQANRERWLAPARWAEVRFKGGFIHAIRARAAEFLAKGSALLAAEPVLEVTLTNTTADDMKALADLPALAKISDLKLQGSFADPSAATLAKSPHLGSLTSLNLKGASLGRAFAASVASLRSLELLCVTGMSMGDPAIEVFVAAAYPTLGRLYLARNELTDEGVIALAKARGLSALRMLCLGGNEISDEGVTALAGAKGLGNLVTLELNATGVTDEGLEAIAKSRALRSLKRVNLTQAHEVSSEGLARLRKAKLVVIT
jgi:uncharacterized protein (TIGR02996 family)